MYIYITAISVESRLTCEDSRKRCMTGMIPWTYMRVRSVSMCTFVPVKQVN